MKNIFLLFFLFFAAYSLSAQVTTEKYVFTTGGNASFPQNYVRLSEIDIATGELTVLDSVRGDFSKVIAIGNQYAYWHVGRATGNPLGQDMVVQYDLVNRIRVDSINGLGGLNNITIKDQYIVTTHDSDAAGFNRFRVYERNDLTTPYYENSIQGEDVFGSAVIDDFVFAGYTKDNVGYLAITTLDDFGIVVEDLVALDTMASGISSMYAKDGLLYIISNKYDDQFDVSYAAVTRFNYIDYTYERYDSEGIFAPIGIVDTALVALFAEGFNYLDINSLSPISATTLPFYSAGVHDDLNDVFYLQETDFGSLGLVQLVDTSGQILEVYETGTGGQACAMAYNNAPVVEDSVQGIIDWSIITFAFNLPQTDIDGDTLSYHILSTEGIAVVSVTNDTLYIETIENTVDLEMEVVDPWGASDTFNLTFWRPLNAKESLVAKAKIYPNPVVNELNIELNSPNSAKYTVINALGMELENGGFIEKTSINIANLPRGTYLLRIEIDGAIAYRKILKL